MCSIIEIKVFVWLATYDKILLRANLLRKGWTGPAHCELCGHNLQTTAHIFLHGSMS